jgi:serine/threonine protein kinase
VNLPYGQGIDWWAVGVMIFEMMTGHPPFDDDEEEDMDDDSYEDQLERKILNNEVDFPEDMSLAAISIVLHVSVIGIKSEALKCHSLLYALECNIAYFVLHLQELDQFPQSCMCFVHFIKCHNIWNCQFSSTLFGGCMEGS